MPQICNYYEVAGRFKVQVSTTQVDIADQGNAEAPLMCGECLQVCVLREDNPVSMFNLASGCPTLDCDLSWSPSLLAREPDN